MKFIHPSVSTLTCYLALSKTLLCATHCNVLRDLFPINLNSRIGMNTNREKYYRVFSGKYLSNRSYDQTFT